MKRILLTITVMLLVAAPTFASDFCIWTLADSDSITGRVGYALNDNIEGGVESTWRNDSDEPGQIWGVFGVYKAPELIKFDQIFSNDWIPSLIGTPYVGASMSVDFANESGDRTLVGPLAGIILQDILIVEYFYMFPSDDLGGLLDEGYVLRIGLHFEF